jgi:hypothetical protein
VKRSNEVRGYVRKRPGRGDTLEPVFLVDGRTERRSLGLREAQRAEAEAIVAAAVAELHASPAPARAPVRPGPGTVRAWGKARGPGGARQARVGERAGPPRVVPIPLRGGSRGRPGDGRHDAGLGPQAREDARRVRRTPSPKYIRKITATARALFKEALRRHLVDRTPCTWEDSDLPELEQRASSATVFEEDRRVLYALEFLTGMRTGEAAARTWADWEPDYSEDLGRLVAKTAYNTRHHIVKSTKTRVEKWIPVHPAPRRAPRRMEKGRVGALLRAGSHV